MYIPMFVTGVSKAMWCQTTSCYAKLSLILHVFLEYVSMWMGFYNNGQECGLTCEKKNVKIKMFIHYGKVKHARRGSKGEFLWIYRRFGISSIYRLLSWCDGITITVHPLSLSLPD